MKTKNERLINMKKVLLISILSTLMAFGADGDEDAQIKAEGGLIEKPYKGKYVVIVNNQKRIAASELFSKGNTIEDIFNFPVKIVEAGSKVSNAGVVVQVNDDKSAPSLLVAPEAAWAAVNVAALDVDKPSPEKFKSRVQKEVFRAYLYAAGVANSDIQPCLMRQIRRPRDLDKSQVIQPGPSAVAPVMNTAGELGVFEKVIMTYKEACQEGWAPVPTNEVQKAIWEKVHALPTNPITIKYDPKRDK